MIVHFDPLSHPRNRMGVFTKTLRGLKTGDQVRMPGGVTITAGEMFGSRAKLRVSAPLAHMKSVEMSGHNPEKVAKFALDRSARISHSGSIGGKEKTTYSKFRDGEIAQRVGNKGWANIPPEDTEDLLARPTHGNPETNMEQLEDLKSEAQQTVDEIGGRMGPMDKETGFTDFRSGHDEDAYAEAEDLLDRTNKALKAIEDMPESEYEAALARHRAT